MYKFFPEIIEKGYFYEVKSPLYLIKKASRHVGFLLDEDEKKNWILKKVAENYELEAGVGIVDIEPEIISECISGYSFNYIKGLNLASLYSNV